MFEEIAESFSKNNIKVMPARDGKDACEKILSIIPENSSVGFGGSMTLESIGILDRISGGNYVLYDRRKAERGSGEYQEMLLSSQQADYFLSGSNAITRDGKIVNMDMTGNRVSSILYGPGHVIIVAGKNKIVDNVDEAIERIKNVSAPMNAERLGLNTPCAETGKCTDCSSPDRICCSTVIIERQHDPGRITLILVNEDLGY